MATRSTNQPDHRSILAGATTMAQVAPGPRELPSPGAEPEVGLSPGPGASTSDTRLVRPCVGLNDGTDYDAADARQRSEEIALAEACDHRHTRIRLIEECECGMVIQETTVGRP